MLTVDEIKKWMRTNERAARKYAQRELILRVLSYLANMRAGFFDSEMLAIGKEPIRPNVLDVVELLETALMEDRFGLISEACTKMLAKADELERDGYTLFSGHFRYLGRSLACREML